MANWEDLRIVDLIEKIQKEDVVLPVIQRELHPSSVKPTIRS